MEEKKVEVKKEEPKPVIVPKVDVGGAHTELEERVKKLEEFCKIAYQCIAVHNHVLGTELQEEFEEFGDD